jgi:hypothetical protein
MEVSEVAEVAQETYLQTVKDFVEFETTERRDLG